MKTIYISSSFDDLKFVREALRGVALPAVNAAAGRYGDFAMFSEFRKEAESAKMSNGSTDRRILGLLPDALDRSDELMVIIVGRKYGWISDPALVRGACRACRMRLDDYEISATELEAEYGIGVLKKDALVYICRPSDPEQSFEDELHRAKLEKFRDRLSHLLGGSDNIKYFDMPDIGAPADTFARRIASDIIDYYDGKWRGAGNSDALCRACVKALRPSARGSICDDIVNAVKSGKKRVLVSGDTGSGKTAVLNYCASVLETGGYDVLRFSGDDARTGTTRSPISGRLLRFLNESVGEASHCVSEMSPAEKYCISMYGEDVAALSSALSDAEKRYALSGRRLVITADGADASCIMGIVPPSEVISVLASGDTGCLCDAEEYTLEPLSRYGVEQLIRSRQDETCFPVYDDVIEAIEELPDGSNPLYLSLLVSKMYMLNIDDFAYMTDKRAISAYQRAIVRSAPAGIREMICDMFSEAARRTDFDAMYAVLQYICVSRKGISEAELSALIGSRFSSAEFGRFLTYTEGFITMQSGGRYDIPDSFIKECVRDSLCGGNCRTAEAALLSMLMTEYFEAPSEDNEGFEAVRSIVGLILGSCSLSALSELINTLDARSSLPGSEAQREVFRAAFSCEGEKTVVLLGRYLDAVLPEAPAGAYHVAVFFLADSKNSSHSLGGEETGIRLRIKESIDNMELSSLTSEVKDLYADTAAWLFRAWLEDGASVNADDMIGIIDRITIICDHSSISSPEPAPTRCARLCTCTTLLCDAVMSCAACPEAVSKKTADFAVGIIADVAGECRVGSGLPVGKYVPLVFSAFEMCKKTNESVSAEKIAAMYADVFDMLPAPIQHELDMQSNGLGKIYREMGKLCSDNGNFESSVRYFELYAAYCRKNACSSFCESEYSLESDGSYAALGASFRSARKKNLSRGIIRSGNVTALIYSFRAGCLLADLECEDGNGRRAVGYYVGAFGNIADAAEQCINQEPEGRAVNISAVNAAVAGAHTIYGNAIKLCESKKMRSSASDISRSYELAVRISVC